MHSGWAHWCIVVCLNWQLRYLVPRSLVVSYSWLSLVYLPTYHLIPFILDTKLHKRWIQSEIWVFYDIAGWSLNTSSYIFAIACSQNKLHFYSQYFEQRWAAIFIHFLQEGHIVANIPNFFHSNSQFPERVIVCSPMTNNEIFFLAKLKIQFPNLILWPCRARTLLCYLIKFN